MKIQAMLKHTRIPSLPIAILLSISCMWAEDKPTERTQDCTTSECHNTYIQDRHVHKPVELGVCKYCHKYDDPKEHTFELFRTRKELCGSCHQEKASDLSSIPSMKELNPVQIGEGTYLHEPLEEGQCIDCHNPHSSQYEFLLSASTIEESCRECHDDINFNVKTPHEPAEEGECTECHDSHSSDYRHLLVDAEKPLCFSCHEDTKAELDRFEYKHKPVLDRECIDCHKPHGSDYFRMLTGKYSPEFYAPFDISNYDFCFSCHNQDKVLVDETGTLTDFRNGTENLHYLHVNRPEKGRTCRTCHATHASDEPKHLYKKVPYGGWGIPIQFEKTETGGGCSPGCHNPRSYDRIDPAIYASEGDI